jgi:hypothetical protein
MTQWAAVHPHRSQAAHSVREFLCYLPSLIDPRAGKGEPGIELQCGWRRIATRAFAFERTFRGHDSHEFDRETPERSGRAPLIVGTPAAVALISQLKQRHGPVCHVPPVGRVL